VDGYVPRESRYGPNGSGHSSTNRGPRVPVPVPVRTADGGVSVVALLAWARECERRWTWEHTGCPGDQPPPSVP
jgi:hypothetical protein